MNSPIEAIDHKTQQATLLLVDDEANILSSLRRLFRPAGYNIITASSGQEGLKKMKAESIDLVISDMRMPEMDGAEFLTEVAKNWPDTIRILLTGYADISSTIDAINKGSIYKYISKPWDENDIKLTVLRALEQKNIEQERRLLEALINKQNEELKDLNENLEQKVASRTAELEQITDMLQKSHDSLKDHYQATVEVFSSLAESRSVSMAGHSRRVAELSLQIASAMNMMDFKKQDLHYAALLHDLGKLTLPDSILQKPFEVMNNDEKSELMQHPVLSEAFLMSLEPIHAASALIHSHHELYDGSGYPDGLKGEAIPLGSRILSLANEYDALQSGTLLKQPLTKSQSQDYIREHSGIRYDPQIVDIFFGLINNKQTPQAKNEVRIDCFELEAGMVLSREVMTKSGVLLLSKGHTIDDLLINKIKMLSAKTNTTYFLFIEDKQ